MAQDDAQARRARLQALKEKHQRLDQAPLPESPEILRKPDLESAEPAQVLEENALDGRGLGGGRGLFRNPPMGEGGGDPQAVLERFPRLREMLAQRRQQGRVAGGFGGGMGRGGRFRAALDRGTETPARPSPPISQTVPEAAPPLLDDDIAMTSESSTPFSTFSPEMLSRYRAQLEKRIDWLEETLDKGLKELELIGKLQKR
ncbi:MAG: hypothetical protein RKR03_09445 [Candidatus Competibacter sp.]|nr:hypothetical protein [Candidatus Competibacter sp.]